MKLKNKTIIIYILVHCPILLLLTSCWDQVNIEDRGFIVGIAIDKVEEESNEQEVTMTNQFIIASKLGSSEGSSGDDSPFTNLAVSGNSLFGIDQKISTITARDPFYEHAKTIIFSEEFAEEPGAFESLLDPLIRAHDLRRSTKVFVASGQASDVLNIQPETDMIPALYIDSLTKSQRVNLELTKPVDLGKIHGFLLNDDGYTIDHVIPMGNRVQIDGVNVFNGKENQLIGRLNSDETKGMNLIKRDNVGGTINFFIKDYLMVYLISKTKSKINIDATDQNNIKIDIQIEMEGQIGEMFGSKSLLNETYIKDIEREINKTTEQLANRTIKKAQEDLQVDFLGFSNKLRRKHYSVWEQIQDNWDRGDHLFSKSTVTVSANSEVVSVGQVDRAKKK